MPDNLKPDYKFSPKVSFRTSKHIVHAYGIFIFFRSLYSRDKSQATISAIRDADFASPKSKFINEIVLSSDPYVDCCNSHWRDVPTIKVSTKQINTEP